jgi:2-dehydro-3-deoxyphosphogluconate aldolase / (4S)-4-hydroxy-2-oxoglutarate aldolase
MGAPPAEVRDFADLRAERFFAVLRGNSRDLVVEAALVLADAGVRLLEISFTCPDAPSIISELRGQLPQHLVGAGTVRSGDDVRVAVAAGAQFVVSPGTFPSLLEAMIAAGIPCLPGVHTPSELMMATRAGAPIVKLFPASFWSPALLRELRGPFPTAAIVPTGGIAIEEIPGWLEAGAIAVGLGSQLCSNQDMESRAWAAVAERVRRVLTTVAD